MLDPLALGRQQLDQVGAAVGGVGTEDLGEVGSEVGLVLAHLVTPCSSSTHGVSAAGWEPTTRRATRARGWCFAAVRLVVLVTGDTPIGVQTT